MVGTMARWQRSSPGPLLFVQAPGPSATQGTTQYRGPQIGFQRRLRAVPPGQAIPIWLAGLVSFSVVSCDDIGLFDHSPSLRSYLTVHFAIERRKARSPGSIKPREL